MDPAALTSGCHEIAVIGAGPAGLAAALALARSGRRVLVAAPAFDPVAAKRDTRTTALVASSVDFLANTGVWRRVADAAAPLAGIRIADARGGLVRAPEVLFDAEELGLAAFGANVANTPLLAALAAEVAATDAIRWHATAAVTRVEPMADGVELHPTEGGRISARLVVAADGRRSIARTAAGLTLRESSYPQVAIATTFGHTRDHRNVSTELHTPAGPCTTVPLPGRRSSLVWVESTVEAGRLMDLASPAFAAALEDRLAGFLGRIGDIGPRARFPLVAATAPAMGARRIALVGEAAHVVPPIGAQGLNLGLRDAATLADCVREAVSAGEDIGGDAMLARYDASRRADIAIRTLATDLLNRSLLTDVLPVQAARGLGLHLLAAVPPLRRLVMRAGLTPPGALPSLMRPRAGLTATAN